jgi:hypothetical protein
MKRALATILLLLGVSGCIIVDEDPVVVDRGEDSSLTIENQSDFALAEIRVTEVSNPSWGPNLIGGDVLLPGESITVLLDCNTFDVLVVDEDDFSCELQGLDLCFDDAIWTVTNRTLERCGF